MFEVGELDWGLISCIEIRPIANGYMVKVAYRTHEPKFFAFPDKVKLSKFLGLGIYVSQAAFTDSFSGYIPDIHFEVDNKGKNKKKSSPSFSEYLYELDKKTQ